MRLALDKGQQYGASQSVMPRLENDILGTTAGRQALDTMITRSTDALLKKKNKKRLILDVDSTLKRENLTENWQMGMRNWFLGKVPHNSD
jgi:hypothetical protein